MLWALSAVEYENLPKPVAYVPDNPDDNRKLFFSITKASDVPIKVLETTEMCSGANGFYSPTTKEICLSPDLKGYQRIKTLLHEITHSKLHKDSQEVFGSENMLYKNWKQNLPLLSLLII